jgi:hypothetical protein
MELGYTPYCGRRRLACRICARMTTACLQGFRAEDGGLLPGFAGRRRRLACGVCGSVGVGVATGRGEVGAVYTNALIVSRDLCFSNQLLQSFL